MAAQQCLNNSMQGQFIILNESGNGGSVEARAAIFYPQGEFPAFYHACDIQLMLTLLIHILDLSACF